MSSKIYSDGQPFEQVDDQKALENYYAYDKTKYRVIKTRDKYMCQKGDYIVQKKCRFLSWLLRTSIWKVFLWKFYPLSEHEEPMTFPSYEVAENELVAELRGER